MPMTTPGTAMGVNAMVSTQRATGELLRTENQLIRLASSIVTVAVNSPRTTVFPMARWTLARPVTDA